MGYPRDLARQPFGIKFQGHVQPVRASWPEALGPPADPAAPRAALTFPGEDLDPFGPIVREIQQRQDVQRNFAQLLEHFRPRLLRHFTRQGIDLVTAEDLCQDVFLKVAQSIGTFEGRSPLARWIFEIAHNLYVNELRRRAAEKRTGRELPLAEENPTARDEDRKGSAPALVAAGPSPSDEVLIRERRVQLRAALNTLPPQMRQCVYLRLYQDLKYREVAEVMHVSLDTVKAHLGEAKKRLHKLL